jgi:hypothetical protein
MSTALAAGLNSTPPSKHIALYVALHVQLQQLNAQVTCGTHKPLRSCLPTRQQSYGRHKLGNGVTKIDPPPYVRIMAVEHRHAHACLTQFAMASVYTVK